MDGLNLFLSTALNIPKDYIFVEKNDQTLRVTIKDDNESSVSIYFCIEEDKMVLKRMTSDVSMGGTLFEALTAVSTFCHRVLEIKDE